MTEFLETVGSLFHEMFKMFRAVASWLGASGCSFIFPERPLDLAQGPLHNNVFGFRPYLPVSIYPSAFVLVSGGSRIVAKSADAGCVIPVQLPKRHSPAIPLIQRGIAVYRRSLGTRGL